MLELLDTLEPPKERHWNRSLSNRTEPGGEDEDSVPGPGGHGIQPELHSTVRIFTFVFIGYLPF